MIYVVATSELHPEFRDKFIEIFKANVPNVRAEEGCISYQPTVDYKSGLSKQLRCDHNTVTILECWQSFDHLMRHLQSAHMAAYREKVKGMVKNSSLNVLTEA